MGSSETISSKIRRAQLDGQWYPAGPDEVRKTAEDWRGYMEEAPAPEGEIRAVIAPHAGWVYSGRLAAKAVFQAARSLGPDGPDLAVVLGGHLPTDAPVIAFGEEQWATPLGPLNIEGELNDLLAGELRPKIWRGPTDDNTIEVQLPLVKLFCPKAALWPLRVPPSSAALALGRVLAELSKTRTVLVVASTDLTHYGRAYGFAPKGGGEEGEAFRLKNDLAFIEAAMRLDPEAMMEAGEKLRAACSSGAAAAAAEMAKAQGLAPALLGHYSSFDVRPAPQSVGYAAVAYLSAG
ncbi:MAG: AmmeMemoRadiSam system protein B [Deltaproteobacteria bacterium]|jgi:AmmeMemoRadiSam system protein B|nr:AmmeMemoRadiSam system protein B [Deltaproteobacteria bacterium]